MNKKFWMKVLGRFGYIFFLSVFAVGTVLLTMIVSGHPPGGGVVGIIFGTVTLCLILSLIVMIPYSFYLYGVNSRILDPNINSENHTAFKNPENVPASSHSAPVAASVSAQLPGQMLIGVDEIIRKAWAFYKINFKKMWPLFLLGGMATIFLAFFYSGVMDTVVFLVNTHVVIMILILIVIFVLATFFLLSKIALYKSISDVYKQQFVGVSGSYKKAFVLFWPFLLVIILVWLALGGASLLFIVPGIILYGYTIFSQVVLIDTGKRGFEALTTSWSLIKTHWWGVVLRLIAVSILFGVIAFAVNMVLFIGLALCFTVLAFVHAFLPVAIVIVAVLAIGILGFLLLVIEPLLLISLFELYYSLVQVRAHEPIEEVEVTHRRKVKIIVVIVIAIILFIPELYLSKEIEKQITAWQNLAINPASSDEIYHSSVGSFSANFLGEPKTGIEDATSSTGEVVPIYTFQNQINQNFALTVDYVQLQAPVDSADSSAVLTSDMDSGASTTNAIIESSQIGSYNGLPSNDYTFYLPDENLYAQGRTIIDGQNIYSLSVVYPGENSSIYSNFVKLFFNSFSLDDLATTTPTSQFSSSTIATSALVTSSSTAADLQSQLYVSTEAQFQINLPAGWSFYKTTENPEKGIDSFTDFAAPEGQKSEMTIAKLDMNYIRSVLSTSTDDQIALRLAQEGVAGVREQFASEGLSSGFQVSDLTKIPYGNDTEYVYRGSIPLGTSDPTAILDFKLITIFNGNDGYQLISIWPEQEYGWKAKPIQDSFASFIISN